MPPIRLSRTCLAAMLAALGLASGLAHADITVGVSIASTGPSASLGIPQKNTMPFLPETIAGEKVHYLVMDDGSDPTQGTKIARRFVVRPGRGEQKKPVLGCALEPWNFKQRMVQARQAARPQQGDDTAEGRGEHANFERHQPEHLPGIERPATAVDGVIDNRTVPLQPEGERCNEQAPGQHHDTNR